MSNLVSKKVLYIIGITVILCGVIFVSFYKLSESPATWTDEGLIVQTAQNLAGQGIYGFQVAPGEIISPSFISTSYPVTYPIALSFYVVGIDLLNARIVMAIYIILLVFSVFLLFRSKIKEEVIWALLLIGSFPPVYGHGKNVLGEVPGLFLVLVSAIFLKKIEDDKNNLFNWLFFGLFFGLAIVTKPIFILILPGFVFVVLKMYLDDNNMRLKKLMILTSASLLPIITWFFVQFFQTDGLMSIVKYYSNPHSVNIIQAVINNLKDFLTNPRTIFAGGSFALWSIFLIYSYYKKRHVYLFEIYIYSVSLFVFIVYFRNPPYYRYFFITEALSLIFLTVNLFRFSFGRLWIKNAIRIFLGLIFVFQLYQLAFDSWVANSYQSHKTETMKSVIGSIPSIQTVFFYQAPEAVIFLKHFNYYQYFSGTITTQYGENNIKLLEEGEDLVVITRKDAINRLPDLFSKYRIVKEFDRYILLAK